MAEKILIGGVVEAGSPGKNKTGSWRSVKPAVTEKCIGCGQCIGICPEFAITLAEKDGKKRVKVDYDYCKGCGICAKTCPVKAILMEKEK